MATLLGLLAVSALHGTPALHHTPVLHRTPALRPNILARSCSVRALLEEPPLEHQRREWWWRPGSVLTTQLLLLTALVTFMINLAPLEQRADAALKRTACREVLGVNICIQPPAASAAIPSISEYDAVQYKKAEVAPPPQPTTTDLAPADGLRLARSGLKREGALLESGSLEAMRAVLREPVFSNFLGFNVGVRGNAANLKPPQALVAAGVDRAALQELLLGLKRLDDYCLSNRVIVFNQEDLDAVKQLMEKSGTDGAVGGALDKDEGRALIADAEESLDAALASIAR